MRIPPPPAKGAAAPIGSPGGLRETKDVGFESMGTVLNDFFSLWDGRKKVSENRPC